MGKLILEIQLSLDGYLADLNGKTDWMIWNWGPNWTWDKDLQNYHTELTKSADCILLSRQMAQEGFIAHWKRVTENPDAPQYAFAKHTSEMPKVVVTKTLNTSTPIPGGWDNVSVISDNLDNEVNRLKKQSGKNIIVFGGSTLVASLIKAQLIDEFHLLINPVVLGAGLSIFKDLEGKQNMAFVKARSFECGVVLLHYNLK